MWWVWAILIIGAGLLLLTLMSKSAKTPVKRSNRVGSIDYELVSQRWATIEQMAGGGGNGLRNAVSEADKLLDYAMKQSGVSGETMAERLKRSESRLSNKQAVWNAHKLRNHLAHEVSFDLVPSQAREAIQALGQALRDLGALR